MSLWEGILLCLATEVIVIVEVGALFCSVGRKFGGVFEGGVFSLTSVTAVTTYVFVFNLFCVIIAGFSDVIGATRRNITIAIFFGRNAARSMVGTSGTRVRGETRINGISCRSTTST